MENFLGFRNEKKNDSTDQNKKNWSKRFLDSKKERNIQIIHNSLMKGTF